MSLGDNRVDMSVEELSDRMAAGIAAWLLHGRGAEGMSMTDLKQALARQVPARWLAAFCFDVDYGIHVLRIMEPEELANKFGDGPEDDGEIWTLPDAA